MGYYCLLALAWVVQRLPHGLRRVLGDCLGRLCWPLVPAKRREMAIGNVACSLKVDRPEAERIAKASAVRFGRMFLEVLHIPALTKESIKTYAPIEGIEHIQRVLAEGKGAVIVTAHAGNWEVLGASLALHDIPIIGVAKQQTNAVMDRLVNHLRRSSGMRIFYSTGVRDMINYLKAGYVIGLLSDQAAGHDGAFVDFFGRLASTPKGAAHFARLRGCGIVPTFITEKPDGTHVITMQPPLYVNATKNREEDLFSMTQTYTKIIEDHVRQHPEEWFWLHNRWKRQPPAVLNHGADGGE